jgi:hypothetical protein
MMLNRADSRFRIRAQASSRLPHVEAIIKHKLEILAASLTAKIVGVD